MAADERHGRDAKKVFHRLSRSGSRHSVASDKADDELDELEDDVREGKKIVKRYDDAIGAIDGAADEKMTSYGRAMGSAGIDLTRRNMAAPKGEPSFDAKRG